MRHTAKTILALGAAALLLGGAGCSGADKQVALPPELANSDTSIAIRSDNLRNMQKEGDTVAAPEQPADASAKPAEQQPSMPTEGQWPRPTKFPGILPDIEIANKQVTIETAKGNIVFELFAKDAPKTVSNFVALAKSGYFDGLTFHRVVDGFVIQGGDPRGDGTGGPGYQFEDETVTRNYDAGIVAMANAGPNTNGSQFFIVLDDQPTLPKAYTIFGKVTSGMDVVRAIRKGDVMTRVTVEDRK